MNIIRRVKVSNFKSFKQLDVSFGDFNVVIGPNASGKSNFIQIFKFLRDIQDYNLDNAISLQGGIEFLRNINIGAQQPITIEITAATSFSLRHLLGTQYRTLDRGIVYFDVDEITYKFALGSTPTGKSYTVIDDSLTFSATLKTRSSLRTEQGTTIRTDERQLGKSNITFTNLKGRLKCDFPKPEAIQLQEYRPGFYPASRYKLKPKTIMMEAAYSYFLESPAMSRIFKNFSIYDFDPKLPKRATPIVGKSELEEDGSNLPMVLKRILADKSKKKAFSDLIVALLPFVHTLNVERFADRSMVIKLRETYAKRRDLPASLLSDGTINITAVVVALYFAGGQFTIIEEPERNIHPGLISEITELIREASTNKQIIVSTHSAQLVKGVQPSELLLVQRDKDGFTTVSKPSDNEEITTFLKNGMGIEELYVQNFGT